MRSVRFATLLLVIVGFAYAARMAPELPALVPTHWDAHGHVNGRMPKPFGVYVLPFAMAFTFAIHELVARSPRVPSGVLYSLNLCTQAFLLLVTVLALRAARGQAAQVEDGDGRSLLVGVQVGVGLLLTVIGNFLGKVPRNRWLGVCTPWTLRNDEVWLRTHRLAGPLFVAVGLGTVLLTLAGAPIGISSALVLAAALVPIVYSYILYRNLV